MTPAPRLVYADVIRAWAIVGVVVLHTVAPLASRLGEIPASHWWAANLIDSLTRTSVPLFVMISGLLLLDPARQESPLTFMRRRVVKVIWPLIVWSLIYLAWKLARGGEISLPNALVKALTQPAHFHLWFLYMLVGLYLITPALRLFTRHANRAEWIWILSLWFVLVGLLKVVLWLFNLKGLGSTKFTFDLVTQFVGYFLLGRFLAATVLDAAGKRLAWAGLGLAWGFTAGATYVTLSINKEWAKLFHTYTPVFYVILLSVCAFLLLKSAHEPTDACRAPSLGTRLLSRHAFAIYLIHAMVLESLDQDWGLAAGRWIHPWIDIPLVAGLALAVSLLASAVLQRIPGVRTIVP
ncbi:MAG: acyltransferase family protein [Magnetococcales bacterium]|nr:acyltransferase family protein [Magnetococcales bacterium]